ncbi:MAG TPA: porin family protein [Chitinophagaceae bacterium]|nr:porin family protein [Chitinophagaceae bacterium]
MKRKPILSLIAFLLILLNANAQKSSIILRGGLNLANVSVTESGRIDDAKMLTSFQVGFIGDVSLCKFASLQPGLLVTGKGSKTQSGEPTDANYFKATTNPIYLEVPLNVVFKFGANAGPNFFAGAGPYLAIGIAGKNKTEGKFLGSSFSNESDIGWSNDDPTTLNYEEGAGFGIMKRFDYGLNGTAGIDLAKVVLSVNYGLGLAKLQSGSDSSDDDKNKHRILSFTIGFKL